VSLRELAEITEGYVGSDLESIGREAAIMALREDDEADEVEEVDEADERPEDESDAGAESEDEADEADEADEEPVAAETEAAASTESLVDDEGAGADEAAEQAEAAAGEDDAVAVDDDDRGPSVEEIKGIGPAYAERLAEIGIETVDDLAGADAAAVAEGTSVGEKRAATWIDRASEF
jgi:SpoVK/Ycf46/Vps4 family AAA+-type ATPase